MHVQLVLLTDYVHNYAVITEIKIFTSDYAQQSLNRMKICSYHSLQNWLLRK